MILTYLPLLAFFINIIAGFLILFSNIKNKVNILLSCVIFSSAFWCITQHIQYTSYTLEMGAFANKLELIAAALTIAFLLHFIVLFTNHRFFTNKKYLIILLYMPCIIISIIHVNSNLIIGSLEPFLWGFIGKPGPWFYLYTVYVLSFLGSSLAFSINFFYTSKSKSEKKQAQTLIPAILFLLLGSLLSDLVLPVFNIEFISLSTFFTMFFTSLIIYGMFYTGFLMPFFISIRTKLVVGFLLLIFLFILIGIFTSNESGGQLKESVGQSQLQLTTALMKEIDDTVETRINELKTFTYDESIQEQLSSSNHYFSTLGSDEEINHYIRELNELWIQQIDNQSHPLLSTIYTNQISKKLATYARVVSDESESFIYYDLLISNQYGALTATTSAFDAYSFSDQPWWNKTIQQENYIGNIAFNQFSLASQADISVKITDLNGSFLGVLKARWNIQELAHSFESFVQRLNIGTNDVNIILCTQDKNIIYALNTLSDQDHFFDHAFNHEPVYTNFYEYSEQTPDGGDLYVYAYSTHFDENLQDKWVLIVNFTENVLATPYIHFRYVLIILTALFGLFAFLAAILISQSFSKPIIHLTQAINKVAHGDYDVSIESREANDEIGVLNLTFNNMIHEIKDSKTKIEDYSKELEHLLQQKDEFIHQLGHDLKNPLTPLVNILPMIEQEETDQNKKDLLHVVNRNVGYIKNLVIKTLELAQLNAPNTEFTSEELNLNLVVEQTIKNNAINLESQQMTIINHVPKNLLLRGDKLRIQELFTNIIENSIKYSQKHGTITITIPHEDDRFITVAVRDSGIGMSPEQLSQIFTEFYKADPARHDFQSTGLGLAISKRIVEKHGGRIWAESKGIGKGTTFFFTLPKPGYQRQDVAIETIHEQVDHYLAVHKQF